MYGLVLGFRSEVAIMNRVKVMVRVGTVASASSSNFSQPVSRSGGNNIGIMVKVEVGIRVRVG